MEENFDCSLFIHRMSTIFLFKIRALKTDIVYSENEFICSGSLVVLYVACIFAYVINELVDFMLSRSVWFVILK